MPREVTDADGTTWSCIQAFAGLGGAQSVRVKLPENWEHDASDEELLGAIAEANG